MVISSTECWTVPRENRSARFDCRSTCRAELRKRLAMTTPTSISGQRDIKTSLPAAAIRIPRIGQQIVSGAEPRGVHIEVIAAIAVEQEAAHEVSYEHQ